MVLGLLGVLGQLAHQIVYRFLDRPNTQLMSFLAPISITKDSLLYISGATQALLQPDPYQRGPILPGQGHEQQTVHLWPLPTKPCSFKRPPGHHRPRPGHHHCHQRPHLVHRPRSRLPHICPRCLHHCQTASAKEESTSQLQLHPSR